MLFETQTYCNFWSYLNHLWNRFANYNRAANVQNLLPTVPPCAFLVNSRLPRHEHMKVGPAPSSVQLCTMEAFYSVCERQVMGSCLMIHPLGAPCFYYIRVRSEPVVCISLQKARNVSDSSTGKTCLLVSFSRISHISIWWNNSQNVCHGFMLSGCCFICACRIALSLLRSQSICCTASFGSQSIGSTDWFGSQSICCKARALSVAATGSELSGVTWWYGLNISWRSLVWNSWWSLVWNRKEVANS